MISVAARWLLLKPTSSRRMSSGPHPGPGKSSGGILPRFVPLLAGACGKRVLFPDGLVALVERKVKALCRLPSLPPLRSCFGLASAAAFSESSPTAAAASALPFTSALLLVLTTRSPSCRELFDAVLDAITRVFSLCSSISERLAPTRPLGFSSRPLP